MGCRKYNLKSRPIKPSEERIRKLQEFIAAALKRNK